MSYISLYRKYRPQTFKDVIGQDVIVKILQNSIINGKINHAYIFSGPRGTGKTSIAKIFAKAVNCLNNLGDVCDNCNNCANKTDENIDIVEIDAASNNGVDEIRDIRNNVKLLPSNLKYKVYIVDEVHMLSNSAFNALLKTLEEPPSHVIFILATTEINKIPSTVLSRCQKFDFKKISNKKIIERLNYICEKENINISEDIIKLIAELSDGGLRDAINLLDQLNITNVDKITRTDVYNLIGDVSDEEVIELFDYLISCNIEKIIEFLNNYLESGKNFIKIINRLESLIKDILIYNNTTNYFDQKYELILQKYTLINIEKLNKMSDELFNLLYELKRNNSNKLMVEIYLIRIALFFNIANKNEKKEIIIEQKEDIVEQKEEKIENNIEYIENKRININNTLSKANKTAKTDFVDKFSNIKEYITDKKYNSIANLLIKATPEVVSEKNIIFSFKNDFEVLLFEKNIDDIKKFLKKIYNKTYTFVAVNIEEWKKIKEEYIKNIKNGVKYEYIEPKKIKTKGKTTELEENIESIFGNDFNLEE